MAADTSGLSFVESAMRGYDFMDRMYAREDDRERRDRMDTESQRRYEENKKRDDERFEMSKQQHQLGVEQANLGLKTSRKQLERIGKQETDERNQRYGMALYNYVSEGVAPDADTQKWMKEYGMNPDHVLTDEYTKAAQDTVAFMKAMETGQADPQAAIEPLNVLWREKLANRAGGKAKHGGTIEQVQIGQIVPSQTPGEIYVGLKVTARKPDGEVYTYDAPMTEGGDIADNAKVQSLKMGDVVKDVMGRVQLNKILRTAAQSNLIKAGGSVPKSKDEYVTVAKGGRIYNKTKGRFEDSAGGAGELNAEASDYNAVKGGLRDLFGKFDANGQFFMPEGADKELAQALEIGNDLINMGVPHGKATNMAFMAVRGRMNDNEAFEAALVQAAEALPEASRKEREAWAKKKAPELKAESEAALREYQALTQGKNTQSGGAPGLPSSQPASQPVQPSALDTPDAVRKAMQAGQITKEQARQKLKELGFGG